MHLKYLFFLIVFSINSLLHGIEHIGQRSKSPVVVEWQPPISKADSFQKDAYKTFENIVCIRNMIIGMVNETDLYAPKTAFRRDLVSAKILKQGLVMYQNLDTYRLVSSLGEVDLVTLPSIFDGDSYQISQIIDTIKSRLKAEPFLESISFYPDKCEQDVFEITSINDKKIPDAFCMTCDEWMNNVLPTWSSRVLKFRAMEVFYRKQGGIIAEVEDLECRKARLGLK